MQTLFQKFGGTRLMGFLLNRPPSTVNSWKKVGRIPAEAQPDVLRKALELGFPVEPIEIIFPLGVPDDLLPQPELDLDLPPMQAETAVAA